MEIRKTNFADNFDEISRIYASAWKEAYKNIVPSEHLDNLPENRWSDIIKNSQWESYVVVQDGEYMATASICPARDETMPCWGEIISIYTLPKYWRRGIGQQLLSTVIAELCDNGYKNVYLWVLEENVTARKFYEKNGFLNSGNQMKLTIGNKELIEIQYILNV